MISEVDSTTPCKLSICISTHNRAFVIGVTIDNILRQVTSNCEIVVSDNASTDNTEEVVAERASRCTRLRYLKHDADLGVDRNFDRAITAGRGEYCWLMSDDDLMKADAIQTVLTALDRFDYSLILVNAEAKDNTMSNILLQSCLDLSADTVYLPSDFDQLFQDCCNLVGFMGAIVIKRSIWVSRDKRPYYGSWCGHVGVLFQKPIPGKTLVIAEPLVSIRIGPQFWLSKHFLVELILFPALVWSLPISDEAKRRACHTATPWKKFGELFYSRALGSYTSIEYKQYIRPHLRTFTEAMAPILVTLIPCCVANWIFKLHLRLLGRANPLRNVQLEYLKRPQVRPSA